LSKKFSALTAHVLAKARRVQPAIRIIAPEEPVHALKKMAAHKTTRERLPCVNSGPKMTRMSLPSSTTSKKMGRVEGKDPTGIDLEELVERSHFPALEKVGNHGRKDGIKSKMDHAAQGCHPKCHVIDSDLFGHAKIPQHHRIGPIHDH